MNIDIIIKSSDTNTFSMVIQSVLAFSAICAVYFSGLIWRQSRNFNKEESRSRRAYLVPSDVPGLVIWQDAMSEEPTIAIDLVNMGVNPCINVSGNLIAFNSNAVNLPGTADNPFFKKEFTATNPLPANGKWMLRIRRIALERDGLNKIKFMAAGFLVFHLRYTDVVLLEQFEETLFWKVEPEGELGEINKSQKTRLLELTASRESIVSPPELNGRI